MDVRFKWPDGTYTHIEAPGETTGPEALFHFGALCGYMAVHDLDHPTSPAFSLTARAAVREYVRRYGASFEGTL